MAANNQTLYIYRGEEGEAIPFNATHVLVGEFVTVILRGAFYYHQNIVEVDCRNAEIIEQGAFYYCPSLRRVKMPGVTTVERVAFHGCRALTDVECDKLETIGGGAFAYCNLRSISLPSVNIVEREAFEDCKALTDVTFGDKLERIKWGAFEGCPSLERITIPLKYDMIEDDDDDDYCDVFAGCDNLRHIDLVGGVHEFVAALHLDEWKNDMNATIDAINQILPNTPAGDHYDGEVGEKGRAVREWIRSVLHKLDDYKQQHRNLLTAATTILVEVAGLPREIVINNILPCLDLPSYYKFELEDGGYEGSWKDGMRHGEGKRTYADGRVYVGNWKEDKKHGFGKYTFPDGRVYVGYWKDGKKHGKGKETDADGDEYDGNWKEDKKHGFGKYTFPDGRVYVGNWKDGMKHGKGKETDADGDVYDGNWKDGTKHGEGKMTYADGRVYEGFWNGGDMHGWGEMKYADGRKCEGNCDFTAADIATKRLYVGNLSWSVSWRELKDHMKSAGEVTRADILQTPDGRSKGCGIVEFATAEEAANAVATLNHSELMGRQIWVREDREAERAADARSKRVYVGNLAYVVAWKDLKKYMRHAGDVQYAKVMTRNDGRSKGFGIVEFATAEAAQNAIETLNGTQLSGRQILVREDREQKVSAGGRRHGGHGRGQYGGQHHGGGEGGGWWNRACGGGGGVGRNNNHYRNNNNKTIQAKRQCLAPPTQRKRPRLN